MYPLCGPAASFLYADRVLRRVPDPLHPGDQADFAALPDEVQAQHDPHEPHVRQNAGDSEKVCQQPGEDERGNAAVLPGRGCEPHERMPLEFHPPAHFAGTVLHNIEYTTATKSNHKYILRFTFVDNSICLR